MKRKLILSLLQPYQEKYGKEVAYRMAAILITKPLARIKKLSALEMDSICERAKT